MSAFAALIGIVMNVTGFISYGISGTEEYPDAKVGIMTLLKSVSVLDGSPKIQPFSRSSCDIPNFIICQGAFGGDRYPEVIISTGEYCDGIGRYIEFRYGEIIVGGEGISSNISSAFVRDGERWRQARIFESKFGCRDCRGHRILCHKAGRDYNAGISAQLPPLLIPDNHQLTSLNRGINNDQYNGGDFKKLLFLFPTAILLALGAAMVGHGMHCCPPMRGILLVLLAGIPISAAVWCFFFRVLGI